MLLGTGPGWKDRLQMPTEGLVPLMDSKHETFHLHTAAYLTSTWCNFMEVLPRGGRAAPAHIHHMSQSPSASCHHTAQAGKRRRVKLCGPTSVQLLWGSALVQSASK